MKTAITLNDTVRQHYDIALELMDRFSEEFQEGDVSAKEMNEDDEEIGNDLLSKPEIINKKYDNYEFSKIKPFYGKDDYNSFFYGEAAFQLFAPKTPLYREAVLDLNKLYGEIVKEHSCTILSQERMNSKIATLHFLSLHKVLVNNYKFVYDYSKVWQMYDVVITANPYILKKKNLKNEKKISIKIITEYNRNIQADYEFNNLGEVLKMF